MSGSVAMGRVLSSDGGLGVKEQGQTDIYQLPRAGRSAMAVGTTRALASVRLVAECLS